MLGNWDSWRSGEDKYPRDMEAVVLVGRNATGVFRERGVIVGTPKSG